MRRPTLAAILLALSVGHASALDLVLWTPATYSPASGNADGAKLHQKLYDQFAAANPDLKIKFEVIDGAIGLQPILAAGTTGKLPDVAVVDGNWVARLVQAGLLQSLKPFWPKEDQADFHPAVIAAETIDGQPYAIMFQTGMRGLFYNKRGLADAGLSAFPATWEDLQATFPKLAGQRLAPILLPAKPNNDATMLHLLAMFWGLGGELVDAAGAPIFFEGKNAQALERSYQIYADLVGKGGMTREAATMDEAAIRPFFYSGEVLSIGQSASSLRNIWKEQPQTQTSMGFARYPLPGGVQPVTILGGFSYSILATAPERKAAAWRFVEFMTSPAQMSQINEVLGVLPVRASIWSTNAFFAQTPVMQDFKKLYDGDVRTRPSVPVYPVISIALQNQLSAVVAGQVTPAQAVGRARDVVMPEYARLQGR